MRAHPAWALLLPAAAGRTGAGRGRALQAALREAVRTARLTAGTWLRQGRTGADSGLFTRGSCARRP